MQMDKDTSVFRLYFAHIMCHFY